MGLRKQVTDYVISSFLSEEEFDVFSISVSTICEKLHPHVDERKRIPKMLHHVARELRKLDKNIITYVGEYGITVYIKNTFKKK